MTPKNSLQNSGEYLSGKYEIFSITKRLEELQ